MDKRIFAVEGGVRFPMQMLWIDSCYPPTGMDANLIEENLLKGWLPAQRTPCRITLVSHDPQIVKHGPSIVGWTVHGWKVVQETLEKQF